MFKVFRLLVHPYNRQKTFSLLFNFEKEGSRCSKCSDLDRLAELLKYKLKMSSTQKKVKILTLAPENWSISKTCNEIDVSEYLVKKARKLKNFKGILAEPEKKERKCIK